MEKLLVAVNSQQLDENAISFACYLARLTHSKLTGIFLEIPEMEEEIIYKQSERGTYIESVLISNSNEDTIANRLENISLFRELAEEEKVEATIYLDKGVPEAELVAESRFADALIVDAAAFFSELDENPPSEFVKNILHDSGCPVIISPKQFTGIDNIIFCYDGSKSSIFAIKQFSHLFPQLENKPVKILYLNDEQDLQPIEERRLTEWLKYHYKNTVEWIIPSDESKSAYIDYIVNKKDDLVVIGTYGRGLLNSFFSNNGNQVSKVPIFISHL